MNKKDKIDILLKERERVLNNQTELKIIIFTIVFIFISFLGTSTGIVLKPEIISRP